MRAEVAKVRLLPLPRWTAIATLVGLLVTGLLLTIFAPDGPGELTGIMNEVASLLLVIAAVVLGSWSATLEFGSGTLQRTLTAQADRGRVLTSKLLVLLALVALLALAAAAAAGGLVDLAAHQNGLDLDRSDLARSMLSLVPSSVAAAAIAFGLGLLTRSLGAAIAVTFTFVFVLSGLLSFVPSVNDLMYSKFEADLSNGIAGTDAPPGADFHSLPVALLGLLVWMVVLLAPGWLRFLRSDLK